MESKIFENIKSEKENKYFFVKTTQISPPAMGYYSAISTTEAIEKLGREFSLSKKDLARAETEEISKEEFISAVGQRHEIMMERRKEN